MRPLLPILTSVLEGLTQGDNPQRISLTGQWTSIMGEKFARHTKPSLGTGGSLCIWVDDSVLAYELSQKYRGTVLKRLDATLGKGSIKRLIFRVGQLH